MMRWWSEKHKLPPNHELCVSQSVAEIAVEMYEDLYHRKSMLEYELEEATRVDEQSSITNQLSKISEALGEEGPETFRDDLIDKWEKEIAEGKTPDLTEGMNYAPKNPN